jgi:peroxiredoxin
MIKRLSTYIAFLLLLVIPMVSHSATIKIKGTATDYKSYKLVFYRYSDLISMKEIKLAECISDTSGNFECTVEIPFTCQVFVYLGYYKGFIYAEPKKTYELVLPPRKEKNLVDDLNPFFTEEQFNIGIKNAKDNDLNYLISSLNAIYDPFLADNFNYLYVTSDVQLVDSIQKLTFKKFAGIKNQFFNDYMKYKFNYLRHFTYDRDRNFATRKYFTGKPILYQNPAYMEFFNQLWGKYFTYLGINDKIGERMMSNIIYSKSPSELSKTLHTIMALRDDSLRELVILKGLSDCIQKPDLYPIQSVNQTLDSIANTSKIAEHREIAMNILLREKKLNQLDTAIDFNLKKLNGESVSLSSLRGKYVYLNFGRSENYACQKEYRLLKEIQDKKVNGLEIVTISSDQDTATFNDYVKSNPQYSWTFLFDDKKEITSKYGIRILPSYIIIDPDGKIAMIPAISPQQNFLLYFAQIQKWRIRALENKAKLQKDLEQKK